MKHLEEESQILDVVNVLIVVDVGPEHGRRFYVIQEAGTGENVLHSFYHHLYRNLLYVYIYTNFVAFPCRGSWTNDH